jgi:hypothetical protein
MEDSRLEALEARLAGLERSRRRLPLFAALALTAAFFAGRLFPAPVFADYGEARENCFVVNDNYGKQWATLGLVDKDKPHPDLGHPYLTFYIPGDNWPKTPNIAHAKVGMDDKGVPFLWFSADGKTPFLSTEYQASTGQVKLILTGSVEVKDPKTGAVKELSAATPVATTPKPVK